MVVVSCAQSGVASRSSAFLLHTYHGTLGWTVLELYCTVSHGSCPHSVLGSKQAEWQMLFRSLVWYILPIVIVLPFLASHCPHLPCVFHISSISVPPWAWYVSFSSPLQWYFLTSLTWSYFYFQFVVHEPILAIFLAFSGLLYKHLYYFAVLYCSYFYICIQ